MKIGPSFVKIGKAVLYPIDGLEAWDEGNAPTQKSNLMPQYVIGAGLITPVE